MGNDWEYFDRHCCCCHKRGYHDNLNFYHDMSVGPCACGAWHTKDLPPRPPRSGLVEFSEAARKDLEAVHNTKVEKTSSESQSS